MKVVHISTLHSPFDQRIFYRECLSLKKAGFEVILLVSNNENAVIHEGVKINSIGAPIKNKSKLRLISRLRYILSALSKGLRMKADIYHLHDPELLLIVPFLKLFGSSRIIYDCHEDHVGFMLQKQYIPKYIRKFFAKSMKLLEQLAVYFVDVIIVVDPGVEQRFKKLGATTLLIYNFPRIDLFSMPPSNEKQYDLIYHGSIPRYHMEVCLAIDDALIQRKREVKWLFFGSYGDRNWIENQLDERSIRHRFTLREHIPHDKIAAEVRKARIGIIPLPDLPKFQFNIPTKLFEFMALEMPVVMSNLPPSRPFVNNMDCAILVPPHDYGAFADAIIELLDNPDLRIRMGKVGRSKVESEFNWNKEEKKLINLYHRLTI
jgi:glycosyltransferase involved in cell wall biosynthesis